MRSQVGRLTRKNKSGSGRKELTERDKWIKEKFDFLGTYIARIQTRAGVNVYIIFSMFLSSIFSRFKRIFSILNV